MLSELRHKSYSTFRDSVKATRLLTHSLTGSFDYSSAAHILIIYKRMYVQMCVSVRVVLRADLLHGAYVLHVLHMAFLITV